ncbi:hypothetical protein GCM10009787_28680 [Streptomyces bangladeshensis]|uniref:Uncharacterized protein n=1 Tax=Streptomyces bangladeshensis TaxID=295352 RepID=A0ABN3BGP4_9ACTN
MAARRPGETPEDDSTAHQRQLPDLRFDGCHSLPEVAEWADSLGRPRRSAHTADHDRVPTANGLTSSADRQSTARRRAGTECADARFSRGGTTNGGGSVRVQLLPQLAA